jgi:hypothetical protein
LSFVVGIKSCKEMKLDTYKIVSVELKSVCARACVRMRIY